MNRLTCKPWNECTDESKRWCLTGLALLLLLAPRASSGVTMVARSQTATSNVYCYASTTNDGAAYASAFQHPHDGTFSSNERGNQHTGDHDYSGAHPQDVILSDGLVFSLKTDKSYKSYYLWDPRDGSLVFSNTVLLDASYAYMLFAPLPPLRGLAGGDIPRGSIVGFNIYQYGDGVSVFPRTETGFGPRRFKTALVKVPADMEGFFTLSLGLIKNADYWGHTYANYHLAASLANGTIVCGFTANANIWLVNPDNGVNTNYAYSTDIDLLQSIVALPNGDIGLVGANRKIRFYHPTYSGTQAPELGPLVKAVDIPDTHGAWAADACAFRDGSVGLVIGYSQVPVGEARLNGVNANVDVVQRWKVDGPEPVFLGTISFINARIAHPAGDSALLPSGTIITIR